MIEKERIKDLNLNPIRNRDYVLYWMQQSQRTVYNHALEYSISQANSSNKPLIVVFGLMDNYPEANLRHYWFMLEGLKEVNESLKLRGIKFILDLGNPSDIALRFASKACLIVCDRGYLKHQKSWRDLVASKSDCKVIQVETDVVVPVEVVSSKHEFGARTIRPKIHFHLSNFISALPEQKCDNDSTLFPYQGVDLSDLESLCANLKLDKTVKPVSIFFKGGTSQGIKKYNDFLHHKLETYLEDRNHPEKNAVSHMSMYLHFGQISPVWLLLEIKKKKIDEAVETYIEELVIRRELSMNFVNFNPDYDNFKCIPNWAKKTLLKHENDPRLEMYSLEELEKYQTQDPYWNASMKEMVLTGFTHNYMRMYWGKKILEWSPSPEEAYNRLVYLNNKYFLDGRDPNGYANIGWIFGLHDRAWNENPIFGNVRIMKASGLKRKFKPEKYIDKVDEFERLQSHI